MASTTLGTEVEAQRRSRQVAGPTVGQLRQAARRRAIPLAVAGAVVVGGMAFSFVYLPLTGWHGWWTTKDIWTTWRAAHSVAWGALGDVFSSNQLTQTLPGLPLVLAPLAALSSALHLSESYPYALVEPGAWLLVGPVCLACAAVPLWAADAWSERLGAGRGQRWASSLSLAVLLTVASLYWGHPEDLLAVGLVLYALLAALDDRSVAAAWLIGTAACFQLVAVLVVPVVLAQLGRRRAGAFLSRAAVLPAVLTGICLSADPGATWHALVLQPVWRLRGWYSPWFAFAHPLGHGLRAAASGGVERWAAAAIAAGVGVWSCRHRHQPRALLWAAALALSTRAVEAVVLPYYLIPALAVALLAATGRSAARLAAVAGLAAWALVWSNIPEWGSSRNWLVLVASLLAMLVVARPGSRSRD